MTAGDADGLVHLFSAPDWSVASVLDDNDAPVFCVDFSIDGRLLAVGRQDGQCTLHDASYRDDFWMPVAECGPGRTSAIHDLAFSVEGDRLAVGSGDWTVIVYGNEDWTILQQYKLDGWVLSVAWCPTGDYLAMGGSLVKDEGLDQGGLTRIQRGRRNEFGAIYQRRALSGTCGNGWSCQTLFLGERTMATLSRNGSRVHVATTTALAREHRGY